MFVGTITIEKLSGAKTILADVLRMGFHVSIAGSIDQAVDVAAAMGCNVFQIFTRNPRGWGYTALRDPEVEEFKRKVRLYGVGSVVVHMPYLPNLASPRDDVYRLSVASITEEVKRCSILGVPFLVTHLGSNLGLGKANGLKRITAAINKALLGAEDDVTVLLENTAGTRNSMGSTFEDIKRVIDGITKKERVGVCFDTCHAFASGYDLRSEDAVKQVLGSFDETIGLECIKLVHLNDSKGGLRSKIDRHEHIGLGSIGEEGFRSILHSSLGRLPLIMETPVDEVRDDLTNLEKTRELAS
jgi:deoxyribonuclease IV